MKRKFLAVLLAITLIGTSAAPAYGADVATVEGADEFAAVIEEDKTTAVIETDEMDAEDRTEETGENNVDEEDIPEETDAPEQDRDAWKRFPADTSGIVSLENGLEYEVETTEDTKAVWFSYLPEQTGNYRLQVSLAEENPKMTDEVHTALYGPEQPQEPVEECILSQEGISLALTAGEICYTRIYLTGGGSDEEIHYGRFGVRITEEPEEQQGDDPTAGEVSDESVSEIEEGFSLEAVKEEDADRLKSSSGIQYFYSGETATLTVSGTGAIPDYDGSNRPPWDSYASEAEKLVIESGITSIGEASFYKFSSLKTVTLPDTITEINTAAFAENYYLEQINIPEGVTKIGSYAFQNSSLTTLKFPATLTDLDTLALFACNSLETIEVASGNAAYSGVNGVLFNKSKTILCTYPAGKTDSNYAIPSTVKTVNDYSFRSASVQNVTIPTSVTTLGEGAFYKSRITALNIPNSVTSIGDYLCQNCDSLRTVKTGTGLTALSYQAFRGCAGLTDLELGSNLTDLEYLTFADCSSLGSVKIPDKITYIRNGCFGNCTSLTSVSFPAGLTEIWYQAFFGCSSLKTVTLPNKVTSINRMAFYGTGITSVTIPASVTYIGEQAFPDNARLLMNGTSMEKQQDGSYMKVAKVAVTAYVDYTKAFQVLKLVNQERAKVGAAALTMDASLLNTAMLRSAETAIYWSHTRPNGTDCFTANDLMCAENIALGSTSASGVMNQWMNSPGHKANILDSSSKSIGIGCVKVDGYYYWVQCFGKTVSSSAASSSCKNSNKNYAISVCLNATYYKPKLSVSNTTLTVGNTGNVTVEWNNSYRYVTLSPSALTMQCSDTSVLTVSKTGVLTAKKVGKATITMYFPGYESAAVTKTITVKKNTIKKASIKKAVNVKGKKIAVTVKKISGAKGYQITYATNKKFTKNKKNKYTKKLSKTLTKLKKGKTYYIKVRAYKVNSSGKKVFGPYSKVKKVKVRK